MRNDTNDRVDTSQWKGLNAIDYLKVTSDGAVTTPIAGFTAFPNSGSYPPIPDDILVFSEGKGGYGHVAIVTSVTGTNINIIEENWSKTGLWSVTFDPATNMVGSRQGKKKAYKVVGWVRENQNITGNPVPSIASFSPSSLTVGSPPQPLNINGSGFLNTSTVTFNGIPHTTEYISGTVVSIQLSATDLGTTGSFPIIVTNPPPGGGASNTVNFIVGNPIPAITSLVPPSLPIGSPPQPLAINGTGFVSSSTVAYNGQPRTTAFVSSTELTIQLTSTDLANSGSYPVYVTNPGPLGGTSNTVDFVVSGQSEVTISPTTVIVPEAGLQTFSATVSIGGGMTWSVQEGSAGGTITSNGIYTPPDSTGVFHVVATSTQDPSQHATAMVTVIPAITINTLYVFPGSGGMFENGAYPNGPLTQTSDGHLFGVTQQGGNYQGYGGCPYLGCGTMFRSDETGDLVPIHLFYGTIDGALPISLSLAADGHFYGASSGGGNDMACHYRYGCGGIFQADTLGNVVSLHLFAGTDGAYPLGNLMQASDGYFYGTTWVGGEDLSLCPNSLPPGGCGTIFKSDSVGNVFPVHFFGGSDGSQPIAGVIQDVNGILYGTTSQGGSFNQGTIFKVDAQGTFAVMHSFQGADGANPYTSLRLASDGNLYGMTWSGGDGNAGVIFRTDTLGHFVVLHSFSRTDYQPNLDYAADAPLIQGPDGFFYGTTFYGGAYNEGTIFKMDFEGNITVLHSFGGSDGSYPDASLLIGSDGNLYGSTSDANVTGENWEGGEMFSFTDTTSTKDGVIQRRYIKTWKTDEHLGNLRNID